MNHEDLQQIICDIFRFRARIEVDEQFESHQLVFPDTFYVQTYSNYSTKLLKQEIENSDDLSILCLKNFLVHNQRGLPYISISIQCHDAYGYTVVYEDKKYILKLNVSECKNNGNRPINSENATINMVGGEDVLALAFEEIKNMEIKRILEQPTRFYSFLQKTDEKAYANFFCGNYMLAKSMFAYNEKKIYCEIMSNKRLSLDPDLFDYITNNDNNDGINIDKLTLVFFVILYSKITRNYTHYAFLYHLIDFDDEYVNIILCIEMAHMMDILNTHRKKMLFFLYSAAILLYSNKMYDKSLHILEKHFNDTFLFYECRKFIKEHNTYEQKKSSISSQCHVDKNEHQRSICGLVSSDIPEMAANIKYEIFRSYLSYKIPYVDMLSSKEELLIRIYAAVEVLRIVCCFADNLEDNKSFALRDTDNQDDCCSLRIRSIVRTEKCVDVYVQLRQACMFRALFFKIPENGNEMCCELDKMVHVNEDAHFIKIANDVDRVNITAYRKTTFFLVVISSKRRLVSIRINKTHQFDRLLEEGENRIKFSFLFDEGLYLLCFYVRPTLHEYGHTPSLEDTSYKLHIIAAKTFSIDIKINEILCFAEIKIKNLAEDILVLENIKLLCDSYKIAHISLNCNIVDVFYKAVELSGHKLIAQPYNVDTSVFKSLSLTDNICVDAFDNKSLVCDCEQVDITSKKNGMLDIEIDGNAQKTIFIIFDRSKEARQLDFEDIFKIFITGDLCKEQPINKSRASYLCNVFYLNGRFYSSSFEKQIVSYFGLCMPYELSFRLIFDNNSLFDYYNIFFRHGILHLKYRFLQNKMNMFNWSNEELSFVERVAHMAAIPSAYQLNDESACFIFLFNQFNCQISYEICLEEKQIIRLDLKPMCLKICKLTYADHISSRKSVNIKCLNTMVNIKHLN